MFATLPILSIQIWLPIIAASLVLILGNNNKPNQMRIFSLITVIITLLFCYPLIAHFDRTTSSMQFVEHLAWLPQYRINYDLGIDGISMPLIVLSIFTTLIVILATWNSITNKVSQYLAAFLVMQGLLVGVFSALDSIVFYIFWEATLIPMYLIIGIWGSDNRFYAAIKFFIYTFFGSALMLVALIYLGMKAGDFSLLTFFGLKLNLTEQILIFVAFLLSFAVKMPMWPVHTWLPDAHTEAPAGGSIVLAAMLLKLGGYGFLRFSLPITPDACAHLSWLMIALSLVAVVYIGFVAIAQTDMKKLIAYSSISHMGFVTLGIFVIYAIVRHGYQVVDTTLAVEGAMVVMISHAFVSGAMFAGVGFIYDRLHTRNIQDLGGIVNSMPLFSSFFMLFAMANAGLPGTSGFVGEFMVILGSIKAGFWISFALATSLILGATYNLWMYKRVIFGSAANTKIAALKDLDVFEVTAFSLLAACVLVMGIFPQPLLNVLHVSSEHLLHLANMTKM